MDRTLETFLTIQKRQLDDARNLQSKLKEELREEREQLRFSKKKEVELENRVKSLERVLRDVRATWEKPLKQSKILQFRPTITQRSIARKNKKTFGGQEERLEDANSVD
ncbi:unnamed protein product [Cylicostephanus goldi]|uniref:Uncharacterized protein n=1 Tax=Cylicostephanus goldi TaxID=71465 RepID=A0A3P6SVG0_CYLGO|nr:unnamed protein product [Cylicostephanus goldi]